MRKPCLLRNGFEKDDPSEMGDFYEVKLILAWVKGFVIRLDGVRLPRRDYTPRNDGKNED